MPEPLFRLMPERGVIRISGEDRAPFLQGLISNDIRHVATNRVVYAALLTPQGKFLHDLFIADGGEAFLVDCEAARRDDLLRRLTLYKLRSRVVFEDLGSEWSVAVGFGAGACARVGLEGAAAGTARAFGRGVVCVDPRLSAMGLRFILPAGDIVAHLRDAGFSPAAGDDYERLRIGNGVPDGSRDIEVESATLLENGFDELNGIDWQKGCFVGQEVTARTRYRGLLKRRLVPVRVSGPLPPPGTVIFRDGREVGEIRSGIDGLALARLRLDVLTDPEPSTSALTAGSAELYPVPADWMRLTP